MKLLFLLIISTGLAQFAYGGSSINSAKRQSFGANIGWMDWRPDSSNGVVIGEFICSGLIYVSNVGWIDLGNGAPANGVQYENNSAADYGVNHDGRGNLRGFAYGANIGWVNFESQGAPAIDLKTGNLGGYIYSANCGWISLSNAFTTVQTDSILAGTDVDRNGLPDAWERLYFGGVGINRNADPDRDDMSNQQEYQAGTNPNDPSDKLVITSYGMIPGGTTATVTWKSVPSRFYYLQQRLDFRADSPWSDSGLGAIAPDGGTTTRIVAGTNAPNRFYRVQVVRPLAP